MRQVFIGSINIDYDPTILIKTNEVSGNADIVNNYGHVVAKRFIDTERDTKVIIDKYVFAVLGNLFDTAFSADLLKTERYRLMEDIVVLQSSIANRDNELIAIKGAYNDLLSRTEILSKKNSKLEEENKINLEQYSQSGKKVYQLCRDIEEKIKKILDEKSELETTVKTFSGMTWLQRLEFLFRGKI